MKKLLFIPVFILILVLAACTFSPKYQDYAPDDIHEEDDSYYI